MCGLVSEGADDGTVYVCGCREGVVGGPGGGLVKRPSEVPSQ